MFIKKLLLLSLLPLELVPMSMAIAAAAYP